MKKVLVVDDQKEWHDTWQLELKGMVLIVSAFSLSEAEECYGTNPDVEAIVIDACVPGYELNAVRLAKKFWSIFEGPMIGVSNIPSHRQILRDNGCDYDCTKEALSAQLISLLGLHGRCNTLEEG